MGFRAKCLFGNTFLCGFLTLKSIWFSLFLNTISWFQLMREGGRNATKRLARHDYGHPKARCHFISWSHCPNQYTPWWQWWCVWLKCARSHVIAGSDLSWLSYAVAEPIWSFSSTSFFVVFPSTVTRCCLQQHKPLSPTLTEHSTSTSLTDHLKDSESDKVNFYYKHESKPAKY